MPFYDGGIRIWLHRLLADTNYIYTVWLKIDSAPTGGFTFYLCEQKIILIKWSLKFQRLSGFCSGSFSLSCTASVPHMAGSCNQVSFRR